MTEVVLQGTFSIDTFDPAVTNWKRWLQRFEGAVTVFKVPDDQKVAYLLHFIGPVAFDMICDKLSPADPYKQTYANITAKLEDFYAPTPLEIAENYRFHLRKQTEGETIQSFVAALHKLSVNCNFGAYQKTALRNQFVFGLASKRAQARLLETKDLDFDRAVQIATSMELSEKDATQLQSGVAKVDYTGSVQIRKPARDKRYNTPAKKPAPMKLDVQSRPASSKTPHTNARAATNVVCFRCGANHLATHCSLDRGIRCRNCGIAGHLAKVCKKARANTKQLEEILLVEHLQHRQGYYVTLTVENTPVKFEVDSGAAVTIISKRMSEQLFPNKVLRYTALKLQTFCKTIVDIVGMYSVQVRYRSIVKRLNVYVANVDRKPLLGREWIRQLKISLTEEIAHATAISHNEVDTILKNYQGKLDPTSSKIRGIQARLTLKENANPVFVKARTVPFRLAELVTKEIDTLEKEGILEKVNASEWATPIVPVLKKNNTIRMCGDFSVTLNKHLVVDEHPLPTIDELFATMAGGDKFSKIDLQHAYLQLEIRSEDRELVTLNTHKGLYRCTRLLYGIASAPAIWQRQMKNLLRDIPGVSVFIDDIRITAPNDKVHLQRLEQVLTRLGEANIRINTEKSEFFKNSIEYCGYRIDKQGIHKTKTKMDAIDKMPRPRNITELRAFIGFVNYYGRFIENLSSLLSPLYELLSDRVPFKWTKECEKAFLDAKCQFKSNKVLAHFNPQLPLIVATDASSYGVGAILSHKYPDGSERVLQYASQTLSKTQRRYSQIDKEAYAIIFAIKKFHQYLYGNHFTLYTDHQPLVQIFSPTKALPAYSAMRMQHYALFLQGFSFNIKYKNTKLHSNADGLSRLPVRNETDFEYDVVDAHELNSINTLPVTAEEIVKEIETDDKLHKIKVALQSGKLLSARDRFNVNQTAYSLQQGIIMVNDKVFIPGKLRNRILQELHSGHFGVIRMKHLARGICWWPGIDRDIENVTKNCVHCNNNRNNPAKVDTHCWEPTNTVFDRVHVDYAGPFLNHYFFVLVDLFSKWPEVRIAKNTSSRTTIEKCREIFSTFGIPRIMVMDNGTSFRSQEFMSFLKTNGITPKFTAPYNPSTNGQAERFVQMLKIGIKENLEQKQATEENIHTALQQLLLHYRTTVHANTNVSPAEVMFSRKIRTRLDLVLPAKQQPRSDVNTDKRVRELERGERVQCRNYFGSKKWCFGAVKQRIGKLNYEIALDDGRTWRRHINQIQKIGRGTQVQANDDWNFDYKPPEDPETAQPQSEEQNGPQDPPEQMRDTGTLERHMRNRRPPQRYGEVYVH
ncbi:uncharacterized protein K02A2.6-like [Osmia bicornis bicornis]|uniref:uncharacterized protein K02A2.6-like n=1 Tax=Osmia bicornis bicornis TaxID=1437191 RepID=UPI001EAE9F13|nr:uncharacterized protein K02A2.6-like [Osmia bicornis bicornis]